MNKVAKDKLLNFEIAPPPGAWNKIVSALDEAELSHSFPSTLYAAEVIPPAGIWNKISSSLNIESETSASRRRISPFVRYAAAACVIGLIAWGGIRLLNNKSDKTEIAKNQATVQKISTNQNKEPNNNTVASTSVAATNDNDEARNDAALEFSKKTFAKIDIPAKHKQLTNIAAAYSYDSSDEPEEVVASETVCPPDLATRYIVMMTPEGNIIRMSKKLSNMVCCVSGEDEDKECQDQMSRWREKVACSPTGHSTGSFLDLLNLVGSLQDQ